MTTAQIQLIKVGDRHEALQRFPRLVGFAVALAAVALFVAPFRGSAGLRAACFVAALLLLLFIWWQTKHRTIAFPGGQFLRTGMLIWVLTVFAYAVTSSDPITSLESWRGDVLTPLLAGLICYNLCVGIKQLRVILLALLAGLLILTAMVIADPFQPTNSAHVPQYVHVGWIASWTVLLASILPLAWLVTWPKPVFARALGFVALAALILAAWFSANRIAWICFGLMFAIYMLLQLRAVDGNPMRRLLLAGGLILAALMFYLASGSRAAQFPDAKVDAISILQQDDRQIIWRAAWQAIAERPLAGHGYALQSSHDALTRQFVDPGFKAAFRQAHNIVLNYAIQIGIPGAMALLLMFASLVQAFWQRCHDVPVSRAISTCGLMLVGGFFLRNMTDDFFSRHAVLLFGALVGMLLAVTQWPAKDGGPAHTETP